MADIAMPVKFLYEISSQLLNYNEICDGFGLTDEERRNPHAGKWILDRYKQMQTAAMLKIEVKKRNDGDTISTYNQDLPNPLASKPLTE